MGKNCVRYLLATLARLCAPVMADDPSELNCGKPGEPLVYTFIPSDSSTPQKPDQLDPTDAVKGRSERVRALADRYRNSDEGFFLALRRALKSKEIDPQKSALVDLIPVGRNWDRGILIVYPDAVYTFDTNGEHLKEWRDISETWKDGPYCREIDDGFRLSL